MRNLFIVTLLVLFVAVPAIAQSQGGGSDQDCYYQAGYYGQFYLSQDLASQLFLTQAQINDIVPQLVRLNYDWNLAVCRISVLEERIRNTEEDSTQSPATVGINVGNLTAQKVTLSRAMITAVSTANASLIKVLNSNQQAKLASIQASIQAAYDTLNLYQQAFNANLFATQVQRGGGRTPVPTVKGVMSPDAAFTSLLRDAALREAQKPKDQQ